MTLRAISDWRVTAISATALVAGLAALWLDRHVALFAWIVASGLGVPPGEDLLVAGVGALAARGDLSHWVVVPMAIAAVVTSDVLLFCGGQLAVRAMANRGVGLSERVMRYIGTIVGRREVLAVALARFVPGLRTLVFASAAARGLSRRWFVLVDACAAAVWVPLVMTCGAAILSLVFDDYSLLAGGWS